MDMNEVTQGEYGHQLFSDWKRCDSSIMLGIGAGIRRVPKRSAGWQHAKKKITAWKIPTDLYQALQTVWGQIVRTCGRVHWSLCPKSGNAIGWCQRPQGITTKNAFCRTTISFCPVWRKWPMYILCCVWGGLFPFCSGHCARLATCSLIMILTCGEIIVVVPLQWQGRVYPERGITFRTFMISFIIWYYLPSQDLRESNMNNNEHLSPLNMFQ